MSMITINRNPSSRELFWFGALLPLFFAAIGSIARWQFGAANAAYGIWVTGGAVTAVFALVASARRPIYLGWMYAALPIGWTVSHLLLGAIFYLVFTPIGLLMRLCGNDPMCRKFDRAAKSYWRPRDTTHNPSRYFKQF